MRENPDLTSAIGKLDRALRAVGLRYAIIGGAAVVLRGYQRATIDIDAMVWNADDHLEAILAAMQEEGFTFRCAEPTAFARKFRMILASAPDSTEIDVSMGLLPFELETIERATFELVISNLSVPICTAEDLIIMKLIAGRPRDIEDVQRLAELHPDVDRSRIRKIVAEYGDLLESADILSRLDAFFPTI